MSSTDGAVIVGGGFAGVACARGLAEREIPVTLLDRNTYHQFQPLLYQVATAQLAPADVMTPLRGLFRHDESVVVKEAEVTRVDPATRTVTTADGQDYTGRHLVLAVGSRANFFGVPGAAEHSFPLYDTENARGLRNRILQLFEDADLDPSRIDAGALDFVVVGGGPTGVEMAGALADLINDVMPERYHDLPVGRARVHLVDHGPTVLAPFSDRAHEYTARALTGKGVHLLLNRAVLEVSPDRVVLDDDTALATRCVIWAGGVTARQVDDGGALPRGRGGRVPTGADLRVDGFPGVYVAGDAAAVPGPDGRPLPQLGAVAAQAGAAVADAIAADRAGDTRPPFHYHDKGIMAMIGRGAAVAELGPHHHELHGHVAHSAWLGVHAWLMGSTSSRVDAFVSWAWNAVSHARARAVIDDPDTPRIDWDDGDRTPAGDDPG